MTRGELAAAYARTLYRADVEGRTLTIRVGEECPELVASWAFLTACNPASERLSDDENARRTAQLAGALRGRAVYPGEGMSPEGEWREASFLVVDIDEAAATALARRFGQAAYVFGAGGAARLVWVDSS